MPTPAPAARHRHPEERDAEAEARALKLWVVLARAHGAMQQRATDDAARHGLTLAEFGILEVLHHRGPLLLGEVQARILVSSGGITYLVDRLVERGLVERRPCAEDRRARYAALTPEGSDLVTRIFPDHAKAILDAVQGLTADEQDTVRLLLRQLGRRAAGLSDVTEL